MGIRRHTHPSKLMCQDWWNDFYNNWEIHWTSMYYILRNILNISGNTHDSLPQSNWRLDLPRNELMIRGGSRGGGMKAWERSSEWGPGCDPLLFLGAPPRWDKISEPFTGAIILMMCFTPSPDPLLSLYISIHGLGAIGVSRGNGYPLICHTTLTCPLYQTNIMLDYLKVQSRLL